MALVVAAADTRISSAKLGILSFFFATTNDGDETYNSGINIYNIHIIN